MTDYRVPDALFSSDNIYDIPSLLVERQGKFVDLPVRGWGAVARKTQMRGTWHFYVDDAKFNALWKHPEGPLKSKAYNCVEANFTTDDQMPMAVGIWRIYQKRWLSRYWQSYDMGIFADLNVAEKFAEINMMGIPVGWQSYATSASDTEIETLVRHAGIACEHAAGNPINMLVYGGGPAVRALCGERGWVNVPDARNAAREVKNAQG